MKVSSLVDWSKDKTLGRLRARQPVCRGADSLLRVSGGEKDCRAASDGVVKLKSSSLSSRLMVGCTSESALYDLQSFLVPRFARALVT